jgi:hypothetical protein
LRQLLVVNGKPDPERVAYVRKLLGNPNLAVGPILVDPGFENLRRLLAACIVSRDSGKPCKDGSLANMIQ